MEERPDPSAIMALATGYWNTATLLAANELNVFGALADGPQTADNVATRLQTAPRATAMLLDGCAGLGLLIKELRAEEALYANSLAASAFLVPGGPGYLGDAIRWSGQQYPAWGRLAEAVQTDAPVVPPADHLGADAEQTRTFVLGMHNRAQGVARGVLNFLDFGGVHRLLDVGGGPGAYAMLLAMKYPGLSATVLDLPGVVAIARELIAQSGVGDRVTTQAGDATRGDYGEQTCDGVLFSGVLHQMSQATIRRMLAGAWRALEPGGRVVVCDMMLDAAKTRPTFAAMFSLQMLLTSTEGAVFAAQECAGWLQEEGFAEIVVRELPPPLPYVVVSGVKPLEPGNGEWDFASPLV